MARAKFSSSANPLLRSDIGGAASSSGAKSKGSAVGLGKGKSKTAKRHRFVQLGDTFKQYLNRR